MTWSKSPQALVALFDACLPNEPGVERRRMFGYPCAFVNGNLFAGVFEESVIVRLSERERAEAERAGGAPFAPMGRPMREYVVLPAKVVRDGGRGLERWMARGLAFGAELPPKPPKAVTGRKPAASKNAAKKKAAPARRRK